MIYLAKLTLVVAIKERKCKFSQLLWKSEARVECWDLSVKRTWKLLSLSGDSIETPNNGGGLILTQFCDFAAVHDSLRH